MRWNPIPKHRRHAGGRLVANLIERGKRGEMVDRTIEGKNPRTIPMPDVLAKFFIPIGERLKP